SSFLSYGYSTDNFNLVQIEVFYMKITMRRAFAIFFPKNRGNDNAVRRCLSNKTKWFLIIASETKSGGMAAKTSIPPHGIG
ncbi:MAG: hypothetical protein SPE19_01995, partial [Candidatus Faecousia sp.]|nr:hypothetical protein [Candidatus Faecousia sp.]